MATRAEQRAQQEAAKAFAQGAAAAAAGQAAAAGAGAATTGAATVSAVEIARASGQISMGFIRFLAAFALLTSDAVRRLVSRRVRDERFIRELLEEEERRGVEFDRKAAERLARDLPFALAITDPQARAERVDALLRQERRYAVARLEAASVRVSSAIDRRELKRISPRGAFWEIGAAEEHTAGCLFMDGKFWPWEVLDRVHPPRHYGCTSKLHSLGTAIATGKMTLADIPDTADAIRRAAGVVMEAGVAEELLDRIEEDWRSQPRDSEGQWVKVGWKGEIRTPGVKSATGTIERVSGILVTIGGKTVPTGPESQFVPEGATLPAPEPEVGQRRRLTLGSYERDVEVTKVTDTHVHVKYTTSRGVERTKRVPKAEWLAR